MEDLFEREQVILDSSLSRLNRMENGELCSTAEYAEIVGEYQKLLRHFRRVTKISDMTTINLNTSKLDLQDKVNFDELTGIYNRRFLDESFQQIIATLSHCDAVMSVLMIDVDFFKLYNDTYGHSKGDDCLRLIAQTVKQGSLRADDFAARYGGEEFVIVLPYMDEIGAVTVANRVLQNIVDRKIPHAQSTISDYVTVSIGVTTGDVRKSHTMENYINSADIALYLSKRNGRNRCTVVGLEDERV